jgi:predicted RND superfamily exporter protein
MFITSCTTAVAFLANYFSVLLPISTFGVYAAIIVIANFFLAMTFFPAVIMLKYYKDNFGYVKTFLSMNRLDNCKTCGEETHTLFQKISSFYGGLWSLKIIKYRVQILTISFFWLVFASY